MAKGIGKNGELFARLTDPLHLIRSAHTAAKGKRGKADVARFLLDIEPRCFALAEKFARGRWHPGGYRTFVIREPKRRLISAAPFRDRVVHHALVSLIEPIFERRFVDYSYACRRGRGTHRALRRAHALAQRHRYVLKGDVVKFFPSLDHEVVKASVRRVVADERFLAVLELIVDESNEQEPVTAWFPGDDLVAPALRRRGLPIGNLTSQFLANVVLDDLDHFVMDDEGFGVYVRYCDDFLVFGDDRRELWRLRGRIEDRLARLRLRLHERKGGVLGTRGAIPFLGFVLHGERVRLQRQAIVRASRRLRRLAAAVEIGELDMGDLQQSVRAWVAHAEHGDTWAVRKRVLANARVVPPTP